MAGLCGYEVMDISVSDLANLKGVSQPAISKRLKGFLASGLIRVRREGGKTYVNLAEWDSLTADVTDPAKLVARDTAKAVRGRAAPVADPIAGDAALSKDPTYTQELTRKAGYEADLKEIEIRRQQGALREVRDIEASVAKVGEVLVRDIDQLPGFAEDIFAAATKGGVAAVRDELKRRARAMRETMVRNLGNLAAGASEASEDRPN